MVVAQRSKTCGRRPSAPILEGLTDEQIDRVRERLAERSVVDDTTGCHVWTGAIDADGYGRIWVGENRKTARVALELAHGPIDTTLVVDHLCRRRSCHRVDHLELVED